jgi:hypothetical protein
VDPERPAGSGLGPRRGHAPDAPPGGSPGCHAVPLARPLTPFPAERRLAPPDREDPQRNWAALRRPRSASGARRPSPAASGRSYEPRSASRSPRTAPRRRPRAPGTAPLRRRAAARSEWRRAQSSVCCGWWGRCPPWRRVIVGLRELTTERALLRRRAPALAKVLTTPCRNVWISRPPAQRDLASMLTSAPTSMLACITVRLSKPAGMTGSLDAGSSPWWSTLRRSEKRLTK